MTYEIYKEHILDLYKNPHNKGNLKNATHENFRTNPTCGDEVKIQLIIKKNTIKEVKFSGEGCAISQASASILTDKIKEMNLSDAKNLSKSDILEMLKIPISPGRLNCVLLPLDTFKGALKNA